MIPTLESLPSASGRDSKTANMSQNQESSVAEREKQPFGEILGRQDGANSRIEKQGGSDSSTEGDGNALHGGGKELPSAGDSNEPGTVGAESAEGGNSELGKSESITPESAHLTSAHTPVTVNTSQYKTVSGAVILGVDSAASYPVGPDGLAVASSSVAGSSPLPTGTPAARTASLPNSPGAVATVQAEGEVGKLSLDDLPGVQQSSEMDDAELLDSLRQLITTDVSKAKVSSVSTSAPQSSALVSTVATPLTDPSLTATGLKTAPNTLQMTSVVGDPNWDGEFAGRINMLVKGGVQEAKIQLSPPDLGRLEIKISMDGDAAKVMFSVDNVAARDAIEQAMPRLRELLGQGGLQLAHGEVADHSQSQQGGGDVAKDSSTSHFGSAVDEEGGDATTWTLGLPSSNSTVDYYI